MKKFYYDLHVHSCLSPCGDDDMTPNNLVNMSALAGLQVIALADLFGVTTDYLLRQRPEAKQEPPRQERRSGRDFIERAAYLAKTKGYLLGWVLVAWGVLDLVTLLLMSLGGFGFLSIL